MHHSKRILLAFQLPEALPAVLEGVTNYVRRGQRPWQVLLCPTDADFRAAFVRGFADGAVISVGTRSRALLDRLRTSSIPVVNVIRDVLPALPSVVSDNHAIGREGAAYFIQRGFRHFAFVGIQLPWSQERHEGFANALASPGSRSIRQIQLRLSDFEYASKLRAIRLLKKWVRTLPVRTAVMCASDFIGRALLAACESANVRVPESIAVLGVDNFALECQLSTVPMSSLAQDFARQGFEAAALLDRLIQQPHARPNVPILVPPGRIFVRTSTDVFAFEDPVIVTALRIIHERAATGLTMKELLAEIPMSRKWFDHRFKAIVGRTPSDEIRRRRMENVRDLLTETDMPLRQIAARGRFSCVQNLVRAFRCTYGTSPQAFRRQTH
ncbi:MAG TPA: substrate-binding domain-containing protein [Phycisphaerae bacterium]|jgi:LacI family transcriptional regulator